MGASRDYSTGAQTAVLDRPAAVTPVRSAAGLKTASPRPLRRDLPSRTGATPTRALRREDLPSRKPPHSLKPAAKPKALRRGHRVGSQQVLTVRGRRVSSAPEINIITRVMALSTLLVVLGVGMAMWLSGLSTQQTFVVQELKAQDTQLDNEIETLNRDLENVRSSAEIARRAADMGMVEPVQPGIVQRHEDGTVQEIRAAKPETRRIGDVNERPVRPGQASSNPDAINELGDNVQARPQAPRPEDVRPGEAPAGAPAAGAPAAEVPADPALAVPLEPVPGVAPYAPSLPAGN